MRNSIVLACLLLAGCGGKPGNPKVRLAMVGPGLNTNFLAIPLARELGYFEQEGLDASVETLTSSTKAMQAMLGGSADAACIGYSQAIQMAAEGQRVRTIYISSNRTNSVLVLPPGASGRIGRVEDLKGKMVGIPAPGSPTYTWVNNYLAKHGVQAGDYQTVTIGGGAAAIAALESGRIDAACMNGGDHVRYLARNPGGRVLVDGSSTEAMVEVLGVDAYAGAGIGARQDWLDRNPEAARRLARAVQRAHFWMRSHSAEEILERLPAELRSTDAAVDVAVLRWALPGFTVDGRLPAGAPEAMRRFLGTTSEKIRDTKIDLAATWTNAYLGEGK